MIIVVYWSLLFIETIMKLWLNSINCKHVLRHKNKVPKVLENCVDQKTYNKAVEYTLDKNRFSKTKLGFGFLVKVIFVLCYLNPFLFTFFDNLFGTSMIARSLSIILMRMMLSVIDLPFDWYSQFVLEEKFGFNKSTQWIWFTDQLKKWSLITIIGCPILWISQYFYYIFPDTWWIYHFVFLTVFEIVVHVLYPIIIIIMPFLKLTPLEDGELKNRLMKLVNRTGFDSSTIEVMDGSKRSSHSNAFLTGFGKYRRIVLYDTLLKQLEPIEIEAVLAHEIGHYMKSHIGKEIIMDTVKSFIVLAIQAYLIKQNWFYEAFGFNEGHGIIPIFSMAMDFTALITFWVTPLMNHISRKHEYEADAFAVKAMGEVESSISREKKLAKKNLSNYTPHPTYSWFYYTHPVFLERIEAMKNVCL